MTERFILLGFVDSGLCMEYGARSLQEGEGDDDEGEVDEE